MIASGELNQGLLGALSDPAGGIPQQRKEVGDGSPIPGESKSVSRPAAFAGAVGPEGLLHPGSDCTVGVNGPPGIPVVNRIFEVVRSGQGIIACPVKGQSSETPNGIDSDRCRRISEKMQKGRNGPVTRSVSKLRRRTNPIGYQ